MCHLFAAGVNVLVGDAVAVALCRWTADKPAKDAGESCKQPKITDLMLPSKAPAPASGELAG